MTRPQESVLGEHGTATHQRLTLVHKGRLYIVPPLLTFLIAARSLTLRESRVRVETLRERV